MTTRHFSCSIIVRSLPCWFPVVDWKYRAYCNYCSLTFYCVKKQQPQTMFSESVSLLEQESGQSIQFTLGLFVPILQYSQAFGQRNIPLWRMHNSLLSTFLPRCMECRRGLAMRILSVCLSVRLSVCQTRELWLNGRNIERRFLHHTKEHLTYFSENKNVWWRATPSTRNLGSTGPR